MAKFFTVEEKTTLTDLGKEKQSTTGDLLVFVKRFRELTLDCTDPVSEETLVSMCIDGMLEDYKVHLENLRLSTFTQLMEAAKRTSLSVKRRIREIRIHRGPVMVAEVEEPAEKRAPRGRTQGNRGGGSFKGRDIGKAANDDIPSRAPPFPVSVEAVMEFVKKAVRDGIIQYPHNVGNPTEQDKRSPKYCEFHRKVEHATRDCRSLKWIIFYKQRAGLITFADDQTRDVEEQPYPEHNRNQRHRVNVIRGEGLEEKDAREDYSAKAVGMPDCTTEALMNHKKFKDFFDSVGYTGPARWAATQAIAQIAAEFSSTCFVSEVPMDVARGLTFAEEDKIIQGDHNCALYIEVIIQEKKVTRALVDGGAALNILPLYIFNELGLPLNRILPTRMTVSGLENIQRPPMGYVTLETQIGPAIQLVRFYVLDTGGSWEIILGRPWIHGTRAVASSYHQCVKFWWNGKETTINASPKVIQQELLVEEAKRQVLGPESPPGKRRIEYPSAKGIPLPDEDGSLLKNKRRNESTRRRQQARPGVQDRCERQILPDGRIIYRM